MVLSPLDLSVEEAEYTLVGACLEERRALLTALSILPLEPFRCADQKFLSGVFYLLTGWLKRGVYDEAENQETILARIADGVWPISHSTIPDRPLKERIAADGAALTRCFCPWPGVNEYIVALCRELRRGLEKDRPKIKLKFQGGIQV